MVDVGRALKMAESTGEIVFGVKETKKAVEGGEAQMIILSRNCPSKFLRSDHGIKTHEFKGTNMELGALCGKPFSVSAIAIIDKGSSNILSLG